MEIFDLVYMKDLVCDVFLLGFSSVYSYQIICYIAKC